MGNPSSSPPAHISAKGWTGALISVILRYLIDTMLITLGLSVIGHQKKSLLIFAYHMQTCSDIQHNMDTNSGAFGSTKVRSMTLNWDQAEASNISNTFDVIVASDCAFFKEFHKGLAFAVKLLLRNAGISEAIFFSPRRGNSLDKFLEEIEENGMHFCVTENYDTEVLDASSRVHE
ncbi:calmodulin-lysine N-methyltransferase isoform X4 [Hevea brasiliensis]|uniref:calmodulin-lysine N-methyltransferase isoform X4 n=1 Tax=Hevea brasiliensis TaxID=3981 RepID=UPI000B7825DA|nr:calmodulin-lysine N-methyltransferase isoform X4 [Hevea brasiliensis]